MPAPATPLRSRLTTHENIQYDQRACTGTAIAQYVVLTAGHCIDDMNYFYDNANP